MNTNWMLIEILLLLNVACNYLSVCLLLSILLIVKRLKNYRLSEGRNSPERISKCFFQCHAFNYDFTEFP